MHIQVPCSVFAVLTRGWCFGVCNCAVQVALQHSAKASEVIITQGVLSQHNGVLQHLQRHS